MNQNTAATPHGSSPPLYRRIFGTPAVSRPKPIQERRPWRARRNDRFDNFPRYSDVFAKTLESMRDRPTYEIEAVFDAAQVSLAKRKAAMGRVL